MLRIARWPLVASLLVLIVPALLGPIPARAAVTREQVENAIREGVHYLKQQQRADGSWAEADNEAHTGTTSLVTLALLTAGEPPRSPHVARALEFLRNFGPEQLKSVYAVALQTM